LGITDAFVNNLLLLRNKSLLLCFGIAAGTSPPLLINICQVAYIDQKTTKKTSYKQFHTQAFRIKINFCLGVISNENKKR
jgi:hypothetical protein